MHDRGVRYFVKGENLIGEWSDRALDDMDRDTHGIKISASVPLNDYNTYELARLACESILLMKYDKWLEERQ